MSNQLRYKGQFIKKKVLEKKLKIIAGRVKKLSEVSDSNLCAGRRIVELKLLGQNLICSKCKELISLKNVMNEVHLGLNSILAIKCLGCGVVTNVHTGLTHVTKNRSTHSDVNSRAVLGNYFFIYVEMVCNIEL